MRISVIGGDLRQLTLARLLEEEGFYVLCAGFDSELEISDKIWESDVLIFPVPVTNDGVYVNAPYTRKNIELNPEKLKNTKLILGGNITKEAADIFEKAQVEYIDYAKRDDFKIKNAVPTAEGAIETAFAEMPVTLDASNCLVVGFGRIGKILSSKLKALGANVSASARNCTDLAWIEALGYNPIHNSDLKNEISGFDVIFNTVPAMVLDKSVLSGVHSDTLIIDLASKPGGVDFATAKDLGLKVIWSLGLPGKAAPITAGKIIKDTVMNIIR